MIAPQTAIFHQYCKIVIPRSAFSKSGWQPVVKFQKGFDRKKSPVLSTMKALQEKQCLRMNDNSIILDTIEQGQSFLENREYDRLRAFPQRESQTYSLSLPNDTSPLLTISYYLWGWYFSNSDFQTPSIPRQIWWHFDWSNILVPDGKPICRSGNC